MFLPNFRLIANRLAKAAPLLFAVLLWQIVSSLGVLDNFLFPEPITVIQRLYFMIFGFEVLPDLASSLLKIAIALFAGSSLGTLIGIILYKWDCVYNTFSPILDFFRSVPATALFPLFLLIFGIGDPTNVALAIWICAIYLSLHVSKGLRSTSETSLIVAKSLKKSEFETLLHIRFMEAMPTVFVGFRIAVSLTVVVVIVSEMFIGTRTGLGKALIDAAYVYDIPKLYGGIILIGIIGYLLNYIIIKSEQKIVHWQ
jgi:NitT/TauT family transport system permease protein